MEKKNKDGVCDEGKVKAGGQRKMERKELGESGLEDKNGKIEEDESLKREEGNREGRRREGWLAEGEVLKDRMECTANKIRFMYSQK